MAAAPDAETIAKAIVAEMRASGHALWIDPEIHAEQHKVIPSTLAFVEEMKTERKEREARRQRVTERIAGSVILSVIALLVTLLGAGALAWARSKFSIGN
jgi:hypothetical protein